MRTITIKSKGSIKISPDQAEVQLSLSSTKKDYAKAVSTENEKLQRLQGACQSAGIEWDQVKAASFDVSTEYHSERDKNDNYHRVFDGYCASHELVIRFPLDTALLNRALSEISMADTGTEIEVKFTFADQDGAARALLKDAAVKAREKAQILCDAAGAELGQLQTIDYNWGELRLYSEMTFEDCMPDAVPAGAAGMPELNPEDIDVSDTVTFVWELA